MRNQRHLDSTRQNNYTVWKLFNQFCLRLDSKPISWEQRLTLFVGYLVQQHRKSSTVKSYISAIRTVLLQDGFELNEERYLLTSLTTACKYVSDSFRVQLPIKKGMLNILIRTTRQHYMNVGQPFLACLYTTMLATAYYGLLRISEISSGTSGSHPLLAKDVHVGTIKQKILLVLRSSKTHCKESKPKSVKISSTGKAEQDICPYGLLHQYCTIRKSVAVNEEPFFVFSDRSPVTTNQFRKMLKFVVKEVGFQNKKYGSHGLHAVQACDMFKMGLSIENIKKVGRWKSNSIYSYLKLIWIILVLQTMWLLSKRCGLLEINSSMKSTQHCNK